MWPCLCPWLCNLLPPLPFPSSTVFKASLGLLGLGPGLMGQQGGWIYTLLLQWGLSLILSTEERVHREVGWGGPGSQEISEWKELGWVPSIWS